MLVCQDKILTGLRGKCKHLLVRVARGAARGHRAWLGLRLNAVGIGAGIGPEQELGL